MSTPNRLLLKNIKLKYIMYVIFFLIILVGISLTVHSKYFANNLFKPSQECLSQSDGYKKWFCLKPYFEKITNEVSANAAMAEAIKLQGEGVISSCHAVAHYIGQTSIKKDNANIIEVFSSCTYGCRRGCLHGVMGQYLNDTVDPYNIASKVEDLCDNVGSGNFERNECFHGIGHGLRSYDYLSLTDALNVCNIIEKDGLFPPPCASGLWMENINQYSSLNEDEFRKILPEICAPIGGVKSMELCQYYLIKGLVYYTEGNVDYAKSLCNELVSKEADACNRYFE